ncbi:MAG: hypothetical protein GY835_18605, partial [bacterium]|nr:hypothetical protein [bacterium]
GSGSAYAYHSVPGATDVWVHFAYQGTENGSFEYPYNTLAEGLAAVPSGGILTIKKGTSAETLVINQNVTITSWGGRVTIGQ